LKGKISLNVFEIFFENDLIFLIKKYLGENWIF